MLHALTQHLQAEFRAALRNPSQLLMAYLFPLGFTLVMGAFMPDLNPTFRPVMLSSFAVIAVMVGALLGLPTPMVEARATGVLRGFRVLGIPDAAAVGVPGLAGSLHALLAATGTALISVLLFNAPVPESVAACAAVLVLSVFSFMGLGTLVGVLSTSSRATVLLSQVLFLPSMLLGGMMVPWAVLPERVRPISLALPTTHAMQLLESLAYQRPAALEPSIHGLALAATGVLAWGMSVALNETEPREQKSWRAVLLLVALAPLLLTGLMLPSP